MDAMKKKYVHTLELYYVFCRINPMTGEVETKYTKKTRNINQHLMTILRRPLPMPFDAGELASGQNLL